MKASSISQDKIDHAIAVANENRRKANLARIHRMAEAKS